MKKGALRNFTKFTGKHLRQSLFVNKVARVSLLIKLQASGLQLYIKKEALAQAVFL